MHKTLLFFSLILSLTVQAQTITSDWFFGPGDIFTAAEALNPEMIDLPEGGVDQVWDFSILESAGEGPNEYLSPDVMSQDSIFPNATAAVGLPGVVEIFYDTSGDTLELTGLYIVAPQGEIFVDYVKNQGELLAVSPMIYSDTINHTVAGTVTLGTMIVPAIASQRLSFNGTGSVTTPAGTNINCVYLKTEVFTTDGEVGTTVHLFLKNSFRNVICQITEQLDDATGLIERSVFWQTDFEGSTSTEDESTLTFDLRANTDGRLNLISETDIDSHIQVINMNGAVISSANYNLQSGDNHLDYSELGESGSYVLFVQDKETGQFSTMQFSIIK